MNQLNEQQLVEIKAILQQFSHPTLQKDLIALNAFKKAELGAIFLELKSRCHLRGTVVLKP